MDRVKGKSCPFFKSSCLASDCAMFDGKMKNCAMNMLWVNLYKLATAIENTSSDAGPKPPVFPIMK